jgi:hypothetical protein
MAVPALFWNNTVIISSHLEIFMMANYWLRTPRPAVIEIITWDRLGQCMLANASYPGHLDNSGYRVQKMRKDFVGKY